MLIVLGIILFISVLLVLSMCRLSAIADDNATRNYNELMSNIKKGKNANN